jgi:hypothetical protein
MCLTLWEWVFREADQRVGQRVGCLAIEVVKLLVELLIKLYQTGPKFADMHFAYSLNVSRTIFSWVSLFFHCNITWYSSQHFPDRTEPHANTRTSALPVGYVHISMGYPMFICVKAVEAPRLATTHALSEICRPAARSCIDHNYLYCLVWMHTSLKKSMLTCIYSIRVARMWTYLTSILPKSNVCIHQKRIYIIIFNPLHMP